MSSKKYGCPDCGKPMKDGGLREDEGGTVHKYECLDCHFVWLRVVNNGWTDKTGTY